MFAHDTSLESAFHFSRFDHDSPFSTVSKYPFLLDGARWLTAEHYYQANKFKGRPFAQKIIEAADGGHAYKLGNGWLRRKNSGWKDRRKVYMTRALYRKVMEFPDVKSALLATEDQLMVETSSYDYYWGIGRDQRGENTLGKIWMDIRQKLIATE